MMVKSAVCLSSCVGKLEIRHSRNFFQVPTYVNMGVGIVIKSGLRHEIWDFMVEEKEHWTWHQEN